VFGGLQDHSYSLNMYSCPTLACCAMRPATATISLALFWEHDRGRNNSSTR
jgi:hypothetical protein